MVQNSNPLKSVHWEAVADGVFVKYSSTQHYQNTTDSPLEIHYSFPLPYGRSVLTKFTATLNGVTRVATALPKVTAEKKYEDAFDAGDTPIMLEVGESDFCTASLGNIKPGENADITVEYLQMFQFTDGKARFTIPTVLDDRYSKPGDMTPMGRRRVTTNIFADYGLSGSLRLKGALSNAKVSSPTHKLVFQPEEKDTIVSLAPNAKMDRDVVIDLYQEPSNISYIVPDRTKWLTASMFNPTSSDEKSHLDLSILLDCSGSMGFSRIGWAKASIQRLIDSLERGDEIGIFKFGSTFEIVNDGCKIQDSNNVKCLKRIVSQVEADLGGTELNQAIRQLGNARTKKDVLLLTDGEVWDPKNILKSSVATGSRFFILGIGLAPNNNLLLKIAEATGGTYLSVYNENDIEFAVRQIADRIRSPKIEVKQVAGDVPGIWTSPLPKNAFSNESLTVFERKGTRPKEGLSLSYAENGTLKTIGSQILDCPFPEELPKLAAQIRLLNETDPEVQKEIGLKYGLTGPQTNLLLVVERRDDDKVKDLAELAIVPQMAVADRFDFGSRKPQRMYCRTVDPNFESRLRAQGYPDETRYSFDITRKRIRQIEAKAIRKLRHPCRSDKLKSYLENTEEDYPPVENKKSQTETRRKREALIDLFVRKFAITSKLAEDLLLTLEKVKNLKPENPKQFWRLFWYILQREHTFLWWNLLLRDDSRERSSKRKRSFRDFVRKHCLLD